MLYIGVAEVDERLFFHALTSKCSLVQRAEDDNHTQQSHHNYDVRQVGQSEMCWIICDKKHLRNSRINFYRTVIRPTVLYRTECWIVKDENKHK